jgi:hypothetical protein
VTPPRFFTVGQGSPLRLQTFPVGVLDMLAPAGTTQSLPAVRYCLSQTGAVGWHQNHQDPDDRYTPTSAGHVRCSCFITQSRDTTLVTASVSDQTSYDAYAESHQQCLPKSDSRARTIRKSVQVSNRRHTDIAIQLLKHAVRQQGCTHWCLPSTMYIEFSSTTNGSDINMAAQTTHY